MKKGTFYILFCFILWGTLPVYWKLLDQVNSIYILASRVVWSFVFCVIIIFFRRKTDSLKLALKNKRTVIFALLAGIMVTINWGFYIIAINSGHVLDASLAYYMNPIMAVLLGAIIYKEKLMLQQWLAVGIAALGVGYSVALYGSFPYFAMIIGGSFALYGALKKQLKIDNEVALFMETMLVLPFALAYLIWAGYTGVSGVENLEGIELLLLPLSGAITSIPLILYAEGMKTTELSTSGILMYSNPTIQLLLGVLLYGEVFTKANAVTFGFIWVAILVYLPTMLRKSNRSLET